MLLRFAAIVLAIVGAWLLIDQTVAALAHDTMSGLRILIGLIALVGGLVLLQLQKQKA